MGCRVIVGGDRGVQGNLGVLGRRIQLGLWVLCVFGSGPCCGVSLECRRRRRWVRSRARRARAAIPVMGFEEKTHKSRGRYQRPYRISLTVVVFLYRIPTSVDWRAVLEKGGGCVGIG